MDLENISSDLDKEKEDEIVIDFGRIKEKFKNIFSHKREDKESLGEKDSEIEFDFSKIINYFNQHKKILVPLILILIAISVSIYLRLHPVFLPKVDGWARNNVYNYYKSQIRSQIERQYPNLPQQNKNSLVEREFQRFLQNQKKTIEQQVESTANYLKSRLKDEKGQTYLLAIDPYFWLRHARNIITRGHPGDKLVNGRPYDTYMFAPIGRFVPHDMFHAYFEAYLYKFVHFFNRDVTLMQVAFYIPVILSALTIIPTFFIARKLGGNFGGFIAAMIIAIHPNFLTRTAGGFADTDAYNVLFPLIITWLFLESLESNSYKRKLWLSLVSGFFVGLFCFTWGGWWYIFQFLIASSIIYIICNLLIHRKEKKFSYITPILTSLIVFLLASCIFVTIFVDFKHFLNIFGSTIRFTKMKEVAITTVWPNVFTTVAEQNPASLNSVISQIGMGSWFIFLIGLLGITLTTVKKESKKKSDFIFIAFSVMWYLILLNTKLQNLIIFIMLIGIPLIIKLLVAIKERDTQIDLKLAILLILWFGSTIYASTKGVRFTLLLVPAFSIGFGITLGITYYYLANWLSKEMRTNKVLAKVAVTAILLSILINPLHSAKVTAENEIPSMSDAWYESLNLINKNASKNAIINSWWDFGHWFKAIGNRSVTFDGTSQNTPMAHWIGKVLLTDNETVAIGILRMLDCGSNRAFEQLNSIIKDTPRSVKILYEIIVNDRNNAKEILEGYGLNATQIKAVLKYTHCDPPENYFIASEDMIGKSGVWAHFGSWDFERALIYSTLKKKEYRDVEKGVKFLQQRYNYSRDRAEEVYYEVRNIRTNEQANSWIAPWPSYGNKVGCNKDGNLLRCGNGLFVNLTSHDAWFLTQDGKMHPTVLAYLTKEDIKRKRFSDNTLPYSVLLIPKSDGYDSLLLTPPLEASMFTRLFFLKGHGLKHFKLFTHKRSIVGGDIYVWKVDWQGGNKNIMDVLKTRTAKKGDKVTVNYIAWYENGSIFDSSIKNWEKENITNKTSFDLFKLRPISFIIGSNTGIHFENATIGMREGETKVIKKLDSNLNTTLFFKIRLERIE